ncbi:MAG: hypothetical protein ACE5GA_06620 [Candidatus Zixiibacteriota bacterium]
MFLLANHYIPSGVLRLSLALLLGVMVIVSCEDTSPGPSLENCNTPPGSDDTLHGEYVFTDKTSGRDITTIQQSIFLFRANGKFFIRPDLSVTNPQRRFQDGSADYQFTGNALFLTNPTVNPSTQGKSAIPSGEFSYKCAGDSMIFTSVSSKSPPDTTMRFAFFNIF